MPNFRVAFPAELLISLKNTPSVPSKFLFFKPGCWSFPKFTLKFIKCHPIIDAIFQSLFIKVNGNLARKTPSQIVFLKKSILTLWL